MWFWSVSLANQLSNQFLICLGQPQKNCPVSDSTFFVRSLEFFIRSFLKIGHSLVSRLDKKKSREWKKYKSNNSFWPTQKNEKLTGQLVGQETEQNHMDVPKQFRFGHSYQFDQTKLTGNDIQIC